MRFLTSALRPVNIVLRLRCESYLHVLRVLLLLNLSWFCKVIFTLAISLVSRSAGQQIKQACSLPDLAATLASSGTIVACLRMFSVLTVQFCRLQNGLLVMCLFVSIYFCQNAPFLYTCYEIENGVSRVAVAHWCCAFIVLSACLFFWF